MRMLDIETERKRARIKKKNTVVIAARASEMLLFVTFAAFLVDLSWALPTGKLRL